MRQTKTRTLRQRIGRLPEDPPTAEELAAIQEARRELSEFVTLKQLRHELVHRRRQSRAKKPQARSRR
jgi:hypothetical protein